MDQVLPTSESPHISMGRRTQEGSLDGRMASELSSKDFNTYKSSKAAILGKFLLVAVVVAALAAATFFSCGAALGFISAGAAAWKIGFTSIAAIASMITLGGSLYYAVKDQMFVDTGHNKEDAKNFLKDTFKTTVAIAAYGIDFFKDYMIWDMIFEK